MRAIRQTTQFKKDIKRVKKRGKDFSKLKGVIERLARGETLEARYRDHALSGTYRGTRDCHIEPDWVLIYELPGPDMGFSQTFMIDLLILAVALFFMSRGNKI